MPKEQIRRRLITIITFLANTQRREGNLNSPNLRRQGKQGEESAGACRADSSVAPEASLGKHSKITPESHGRAISLPSRLGRLEQRQVEKLNDLGVQVTGANYPQRL